MARCHEEYSEEENLEAPMRGNSNVVPEPTSLSGSDAIHDDDDVVDDDDDAADDDDTIRVLSIIYSIILLSILVT
jgi:hypothetical protein